MESRALFVQFDAHSRSVTFGNLRANGVEKRLNVSPRDVRFRRFIENRGQRFLCFIFTF